MLQVALPIDESRYTQRDGENAFPGRHRPILRGPTGKPVVKVFIFLARDEYALCMHDDESNLSGTVSGLHIFDTVADALPSPLPHVWVAFLEAGGEPLLSTPNVPHMVLTLQDCVMVEQRLHSGLFMDDVTVWMKRAEGWMDAPIMYPFIEEVLMDERKIQDEFIVPLLHILEDEKTDILLRLRAASSLHSMLSGDAEVYAISERCRSEVGRRITMVQTMADAGASQPEGSHAVAFPGTAENGTGVPASLVVDDRYAESLAAMARMDREARGVYECPGRAGFCALIHEDGKARFGPTRGSMVDAGRDGRELRMALKRGEERIESVLVAMKR